MAGRRREGESVMRGWIVGALLLLGGCTTAQPTPKVPLSAADLDPHQGIVIFGLSVTRGQPSNLGVYPGVWGYWIAYDPTTGKRIGTDTWEMNTGSGIFMADDMKSGATGYRFFKLPPGDYAIGFMRDVTNQVATNYMFVAGSLQQAYNQYLTGARADIGDPTLLPDAQVLPSTPRFHVAAGEVIYIGDLNFDVGDRFGLHWSLSQSDAAARSFAATAGADATARLIARPVMHVDGTPIGKPDVVATIASSQVAAQPATAAPTPSPVDTPSAGAAISGFGLVGTWSADCSQAASEGPLRVTYTVMASGAPTIDSETRMLRTHYTILSAERVGDNQIHLTVDAIRVDAAANVVKTTASAGTQYDETIEKTGDRIQVRQSQRVGGDVLIKDGMLIQAKPPIASPIMDRCAGS
jgi:hypothetical protein